MFFPVVMYGCENWTIKKTECQTIDAFELWCWRRLLRVPWTARRSNQSILKEISPEHYLERLILKLKLQYFGHLKWRTNLFEKTLMLGKIEGRRRRGWQRIRWDGWMASLTQWTWVWTSSGSWWWTGKPGVLQPIGSQRVEHDWVTELNWTELRYHGWYLNWIEFPFNDTHWIQLNEFNEIQWVSVQWYLNWAEFHGYNHHLQWFWSPRKIVCHCFHCFPIYLPWSDGTGWHDLSFLNVEF